MDTILVAGILVYELTLMNVIHIMLKLVSYYDTLSLSPLAQFLSSVVEVYRHTCTHFGKIWCPDSNLFPSFIFNFVSVYF